MTIRVAFKCGHPSVTVTEPITAPPVCPVCGERQIGQTFAPAPRFAGVGSGPLMKGRDDGR